MVSALFADSNSQSVETDRAAMKLFDEHCHDPLVHIVQPQFIYIQSIEDSLRQRFRDSAVPLNLGKIPDSAQ